jgi:hypothetical protein
MAQLWSMALALGIASLWGSVCLYLANRRNRTPIWFVAGVLGGPIAAAVLAFLPRLEQHCPRCKSTFDADDGHCRQCGAKLPTPNELARMGGDIGRHDQQCPSCQRPYSLSDYRPDALEIFCSWCKASLPREPVATQLPGVERSASHSI